ncbi:hypothetical protein [Rhodanobacter sp. C03]|uniref:hypothetical protein n=1 Tax=Rhodanobacter sp. C03 TaxID=1945858 RepID=UPI00143961A4|nr:hypothetical protein [Rhodanobacter sp. C03]
MNKQDVDDEYRMLRGSKPMAISHNPRVPRMATPSPAQSMFRLAEFLLTLAAA